MKIKHCNVFTPYSYLGIDREWLVSDILIFE